MYSEILQQIQHEKSFFIYLLLCGVEKSSLQERMPIVSFLRKLIIFKLYNFFFHQQHLMN